LEKSNTPYDHETGILQKNAERTFYRVPSALFTGHRHFVARSLQACCTVTARSLLIIYNHFLTLLFNALLQAC
jgi:hypothetical protein